jgi:hypothetical protein
MSAENRVRELVKTGLEDNHNVDCVRVVDELLRVASECGQVRCTLPDDRQLRFETPEGPPLDFELGRARTKIRILCARLGVLCNEAGDQDVSIYGGEGVIKNGAPNPRWSVRFKNTPSEQEFTIVAL